MLLLFWVHCLCTLIQHTVCSVDMFSLHVYICRVVTGSFDKRVKLWTGDGKLVHVIQCRYVV